MVIIDKVGQVCGLYWLDGGNCKHRNLYFALIGSLGLGGVDLGTFWHLY